MTVPVMWNENLASLPDPHIFQTKEWGQVKANYGWKPIYQTWGTGIISAVALVLKRSLRVAGFAPGLDILYIPKGPSLDWQEGNLRRQVLTDLAEVARSHAALFIKIDPDVAIGDVIPGDPSSKAIHLGEEVTAELLDLGWRPSREQIQFKNTVLVDLTLTEDEMLARMKQKTRYNIRLAERKGVQVRTGSEHDLGLLFHMYAETSVRDGFVIRHEGYYREVWQTFLQAQMVEPLIAEVDEEPVAAVMIFRFGKKAWYLYGMSREVHRDKMPNHLLQWEAMRRSKTAGCIIYDLWGAPNHFDESDPLWGVYRFKEGLGGKVFRTIGAWDLPLRPSLYRLYTHTMPRLLDIMRRRGAAETYRQIQS
jgi:peptidoglycan pentaglycine glycine transferase (the first glycine)